MPSILRNVLQIEHRNRGERLPDFAEIVDAAAKICFNRHTEMEDHLRVEDTNSSRKRQGNGNHVDSPDDLLQLGYVTSQIQT